MIKIAGIILISGAIAMAGGFKALGIKESIRIRKALYEFILYIKSSIDESAQDLTEIYREYNSEVLKKTGFFTYLKSERTDALEYALSNSSFRLPDSLYDIYKRLAESIGKSRTGKAESEQLSRYIKAIEKEEKKLIKDDEAKLVLYKKLGVLTGLLAALILI